MHSQYGSRASTERLEKKWDNSGMTDCKSASEFLLRMEITHTRVEDGDDLAYLAEAAARGDFCDVMTELVKGTSLFDKALMELEFYIDYYMAMSADTKPDPLKFGRVRILDMYESGSLRSGRLGYGSSRGKIADDGKFGNFIKACADKADALFSGRLDHIQSFRLWMAARLAGK